METVASVSSGIKPQPRFTAFDRPCEAHFFTRFCDAVESSDWDERLIRSNWIDRICIGVIFVSILLLVPILISIFLK